MIEIYTRYFDRHITVPSPNLAFLCRTLDYKPYSINQSITICTTGNHIDFISFWCLSVFSSTGALKIILYYVNSSMFYHCRSRNVSAHAWNSPKLHLILYISNLKDYSYLYIDTLHFCLPHNISIMADTDGLEINMHTVFSHCTGSVP